MAEKKVGIVTDCGCDLPKNILSEYDVGILYFIIETETGVFSDTDEITAENIISYMEGGGEKALSSAPSVDVYRKTFEEYLKKYDEIIHIAISSTLSNSFERGNQAKKEMGEKGERVHIFDSGHLSTGMGFLVIRAGELAGFGFDAGKILADLSELKERISTTFMAKNADYLYRKGLVSSRVKIVCSALNIHPVLEMKKGKLVLKGIKIGDYERAINSYIRGQLRKSGRIDKNRCFITHVGCSIRMINDIKKEIVSRCSFKELSVTKASATISSNCGPETFGLLFVNSD